jgi:hypothetical protein
VGLLVANELTRGAKKERLQGRRDLVFCMMMACFKRSRFLSLIQNDMFMKKK